MGGGKKGGGMGIGSKQQAVQWMWDPAVSVDIGRW